MATFTVTKRKNKTSTTWQYDVKDPNFKSGKKRKSGFKTKAEANAKVAKEHGYTGLPNGDSMSEVPVGQIELTPEELAEEESKPEYEDVVESEDESYDQKKEEELQKEYFELSDKMYGDEEHSDEEMEAMEKRQDEILDEVEPIN